MDGILEQPRRFIALLEQPARLGRDRPLRIGLHVCEIAGRDVVFPLERPRVVRVELQGAVVSGLDVERAGRVGQTVLAVVGFREADEQGYRRRAFMRTHVLAAGHSLDDGGRELLLDGGVCRLGFERATEGTGCARKVAGGSPRLRLVAQQRDAPNRVAFDFELGLVGRERVLPQSERFVDLARAVHGIGARRIELEGPAVVFERLLRLLKAVAPEPPELLVDRRELDADLAALGGEGTQGLGTTLEESDERLAVALVAIELGQTVGGARLSRVSVDRLHENARGAMGVAERRRPNVGRFAHPV